MTKPTLEDLDFESVDLDYRYITINMDHEDDVRLDYNGQRYEVVKTDTGLELEVSNEA